MAQALVEQDQAREGIRATVRHHAARLKAATPMGMIAALVAAACMPVVWPLLGQGVPEAVKALVVLLGGAGGGYIGDFFKDTIERLRRQDGTLRSQGELQETLERKLLARLQSSLSLTRLGSMKA